MHEFFSKWVDWIVSFYVTSWIWWGQFIQPILAPPISKPRFARTRLDTLLICLWTHWLWFLVTHSLRLTRIQCTTNEPATFRTMAKKGQNHALSFPLFLKTNSCVHACKTSMLLLPRHCLVCLKIVPLTLVTMVATCYSKLLGFRAFPIRCSSSSM